MKLSKAELKEKIVKENAAYRKGQELVSDAEFDLQLYEYEALCLPEEFEVFKASLTEEVGEVEHLYVVGSLLKIKFGEQQLEKWINKLNLPREVVIGSERVNGQILFVSAKIDGCSFVASYRKGKYTSCFSRGDGYKGVDWTEKARFILPKEINIKEDVDIRGEFTLTYDSHKILGFKNRRNGTVGIMNSKEVDAEKLGYVNAFAYQILNSAENIMIQFDKLKEMGFEVAESCMFSIRDQKIEDIEHTLKTYYLDYKSSLPYDIDGLVISSIMCTNENDVFFPQYKVAFKVNSEGVKTTVIGVEWNISKGGLLKPVLLLEPVEIDGTTVSRATAYNAQYLIDEEIGIGSEVLVIKSGEIIPKVIKVLTHCYVQIPTECPHCGNKLHFKGVDLHCNNVDCSASSVKRLFSFLRDCGVENVAVKTLENWGILTFEDLLAWKPTEGKSHTKFAAELDKVFTKPSLELFSHMVFDGCGTTNINKIIDYYGFASIDTVMLAGKLDWFTQLKGFPEGIGITTLNKIVPDWNANVKILDQIVSDDRYAPKVVEKKEVPQTNYTGKKVLFTGTFREKRKVLEDKLVSMGAIIASSVSKELDILFCAEDSWDKSSKYTKAKKLGVVIKNEEEYWEMING